MIGLTLPMTARGEEIEAVGRSLILLVISLCFELATNCWRDLAASPDLSDRGVASPREVPGRMAWLPWIRATTFQLHEAVLWVRVAKGCHITKTEGDIGRWGVPHHQGRDKWIRS